MTILEDMLSAYASDFKGKLENHLMLIEFYYNNSYHSSIEMTLYEALYKRNGDLHCAKMKSVRKESEGQKWYKRLLTRLQWLGKC